MAQAMRRHNWAATPLGAVAAWPSSLLTTVNLVLGSGYPMMVMWGPRLIQFYNDAFRPILGASKQAAALGQPGAECWSEIWDAVGPLLAGVQASGRPVVYDDLPLLIERYGYPEETHFAFSYSPVRDESGGISGVLVTCAETTRKVLGERRLRSLSEMVARTMGARTAEDACALAMQALSENAADIPFALLYRLEDKATAALMATSGIEPNTAASPAVIEVLERGADATGWPVGGAPLAEAHVVDDLARRFEGLPAGPWSGAPDSAIMLPISQATRSDPFGLLISGINPHRQLDDDYRSYFELVAGQIATAVASAEARETERRLLLAEHMARTEAQEARQHLHDLFMEAPAAICVLRGPRHVFELANPRYIELAGNRELTGKPVREAFPDVEGQGFFELLDNVYQSGEPFIGKELPLRLDRRGDGKLDDAFINFVYQASRNAAGTVDGILVHAIEVTDQVRGRRRAELLAEVGMAFTGSQLLEAQLLHCAQALVGHLDAAFARIWTLDEAQHVLELRASAGMYTHLDGGHSRVPVGALKIGLIAAERQPHVTNDVLHDPRVSDREWAEREGMTAFAGYPLIAGEHLVGVMALFARGALGQETLDALPSVASTIALGIERQRTEIERLRVERQREEFLAAAAHDLKTPLTSIQGLVQLLQRRISRVQLPELEDVAGTLASVEGATRKAASLIDELLDVSRLGATGLLELRRSATDLIELARRVLRDQQANTWQHELRIETSTASLAGAWDAPRLERAVGNLVGNAIKYSPDGGEILVRLSEERRGSERWAMLAVEDHGLGIAEADLRRIFERFQRGANVGDRISGSGIGLAYVREIVDRHGGTLSVESVEGQGSTFSMRLPIVS